jgi:hypothetical protein
MSKALISNTCTEKEMKRDPREWTETGTPQIDLSPIFFLLLPTPPCFNSGFGMCTAAQVKVKWSRV